MFISGENKELQMLALAFLGKTDKNEITLATAIEELNSPENADLTSGDKLKFLITLGLEDALVQALPGLFKTEPEAQSTLQE